MGKETTQSVAMNVCGKVLVNCIVMFCNFFLELMWLYYHVPFTAQRQQAIGETIALCTGLYVTLFQYNLFKWFDRAASSSSVESASHVSAN